MLSATVCGDWSCGTNIATTHQWMVPHNGGVNIGFIDGHAKWQNADTIWANYASALNVTGP
jgi:prepilin-type processing-associated H-X9-DG protein